MLTYKMEASVQNAAYVIEYGNGRCYWQKRNQVLQKGDAIFLLLTRSVNVGEEKYNIVTADESHETGVVELHALRFAFLLVCRLERLFAFV